MWVTFYNVDTLFMPKNIDIKLILVSHISLIFYKKNPISF